MDLTIKTFSDLLQILDQRPEWRLKLRESLYPEADIPKALRELAAAEQRLAEAQRRTQEALEGLTTRDKAREREFEKFDERHRKSMEELDRIKEIVLDSIARDQVHQRRRKEEREEWERKSEARLEHIEQIMKEGTEESKARIEQIEQIMKEGTEESKARFEHIEQTMKETAERDRHLQEEREERDRQSEARVDRIEQNVEQLTKRFDHFEEKIVDEFRQFRRDMTQQIGKLGGRWGIHNESIWRQTIATLIEETYGDRVEEMWIEGDQFDVVISNGDHILLEITARFKSNDVAKVIRKRNLYTRHYQAPTRFIPSAAAIHYRQATALMNEGFELIEPELE